jgi:hypothetical protein
MLSLWLIIVDHLKEAIDKRSCCLGIGLVEFDPPVSHRCVDPEDMRQVNLKLVIVFVGQAERRPTSANGSLSKTKTVA